MNRESSKIAEIIWLTFPYQKHQSKKENKQKKNCKRK